MNKREEARAYMNNVRALAAEEAAIRQRIDELRERMDAHSAVITGMPKGTTRYTLADYAGDLGELLEVLELTRKEYAATYKDAVTRIKKIKDPSLRLVLEEKYLGGKSLERIAMELLVSPSTVYHYHLRALDELEIPEHSEGWHAY
jgi:seryl-tRNA synthetase